MSNETFDSMPSDSKLNAIFAKLVNIEKKQSCIGKLESLMTSTVNKVGHIETTITSHDNALKMLTYKSVDIEARSRRKNLIFRGFFEHKMRTYMILSWTFWITSLSLICTVIL